MGRWRWIAALLVFATTMSTGGRAEAQERLCDASWENCRVPLVDLIDNETVGIDVGTWFIKDARIPAALIRARSRGVPVRMIMDTRSFASYSGMSQFISDMAAAGVQMRNRTAGDICHWKLMIFAHQGVIEWSGANFSPNAFVPNSPYTDYEDEVIYFSRKLVPSFERLFDDIWTNTSQYVNYANISGPLTRNYPTFPVDPRLNFPPADSYQDRLVPLIDAEPPSGLIDVDMYRLTMARPVDALIRAAARGVRQRLYFEPSEYSNPARPGNKVQIDRLVAAAAQYPGTIEIRMRAHAGLNHQKTVWLHAQHIVVFGTSNWSDASDDNQLEANLFTDTHFDSLSDFVFTTLNKIFERKFYNEAGFTETVAYKTPSLPRPNTSPDKCNDPHANNFNGPAPCTYNEPPPPPPPSDAPNVVLWASNTDAGDIHGNWQAYTDSTAAGGFALWNVNAGQAKIAPALASPTSYFEATFNAEAGTPYHVWVRMRAQSDSTANDSVHLQFSDSVTSSGTATMRIGSTSSAEFVLQNGDGDSGVHGWGWADNGWNVAGQNVYFAATGMHTVRVQQREDGAIVDQIVLSPNTYLIAAPGVRDNDNKVLQATDGDSGGGTGGGALPAGWETTDVGPVGLAGSASVSSGAFTLNGSGADIWGTADAFRYAYKQLPGDGTIVARVGTVQNVNAWTKAGVMIRQSLSANSPQASMFVTPGKGLAFQWRPSAGGASLSTGLAGTAPRWVRLQRSGQVVTASVSTDGTSWSAVGHQTIAISGTVYVGLVISSHDNTRLAATTIDHVTVTSGDTGGGTTGGTLPSGWQTNDVGAVGPAGSASESSGTFTLTGGGADIWGTADAFRFAYQQMAGDGTIVARVATVQNVNVWTKAGVMIRQSLSTGSPQASMFVTPGKGLAFQWRPASGGTSFNTQVAGAAPRWVKLTRAGQTLTASVSTDGTSWSQVGQQTVSLSGTVYVGLVICSHDTSRLATASFDQVSITAGVTEPPTDGLDVLLHPAEATDIVGNWALRTDGSAATGASMLNVDHGAAKIATAAANPADYFEMTFDAPASTAFRLWLRGQATNDYWGNDSVFVQFSDSASANGVATYRIGTTTAAEVNLEACSGCGLSGWGWQDNGWGTGVLGPLVYFEHSGPHTIRVQPREDGLAIDQIVLSPARFLNEAPGATKNDTTIVQ